MKTGKCGLSPYSQASHHWSLTLSHSEMERGQLTFLYHQKWALYEKTTWFLWLAHFAEQDNFSREALFSISLWGCCCFYFITFIQCLLYSSSEWSRRNPKTNMERLWRGQSGRRDNSKPEFYYCIIDKTHDSWGNVKGRHKVNPWVQDRVSQRNNTMCILKAENELFKRAEKSRL